MSILFPNDAEPLEIDASDEDLSTPSQQEITQWLEQLHRSDRTLYDLMALEVWSIAQTMDHLIPGFWNRFMANRQQALQEFLTQRHSQRNDTPASNAKLNNSSSKDNGMMESKD